MDRISSHIIQALDATGRIVEGVQHDQWSLPTPCPEWDCRELTNHLVGGLQLFAAAVVEGRPAVDTGTDWLGADPLSAYRRAAERDSAAWHQSAATDQIFELSIGQVPGELAAVIHLTEIVVHGADLAVATGRQDCIDEKGCDRLLAIMQRMGGVDGFRVPGVFGPAASADPAAPAHLRLLAFLGRRVEALSFQPV